MRSVACCKTDVGASARAVALPFLTWSERMNHARRVTSDCLLDGFGQLDMQHMAQQLTSLSMALSCTTAEAQWQADANMLAALAQLRELRHLDVGNCLFVPADGAAQICTTYRPSHVIRQKDHDLFERLAQPYHLICNICADRRVCRVNCLHPAVTAMQTDFIDSRGASHTAPTSNAASTAGLETPAVRNALPTCIWWWIWSAASAEPVDCS